MSTLPNLGWRPFFAQQLSIEELGLLVPARIQQRIGAHLTLVTLNGQLSLSLPGKWLALPVEEQPIIGDWVLLDDAGTPVRLLERLSLLERRAAGGGERRQIMAANIDTLFIVTSLDRDYTLSRIERYLTLALEGSVRPVVVLTKADLNSAHETLRREAEQLCDNGIAVSLDGRNHEAVLSTLAPWIGPGETVAFMGSSGVGKSTLINSLLQEERISTSEISAVDKRGKHTTTQRAMFPLVGGGWLIDTPGMRELRLSESAIGLAEVFSDIEDLAQNCRFGNCRHESEPNCAVMAAVASGKLEARRLANFQKLKREQSLLREATHERRERERKFGKMVKKAKNFKR